MCVCSQRTSDPDKCSSTWCGSSSSILYVVIVLAVLCVLLLVIFALLACCFNRSRHTSVNAPATLVVVYVLQFTRG